jgi:peptidoglycan biosynthesis protein MviN/MurJ (putative lipid II flippase)
MPEGSRKPSPLTRRSALRSGILTGVSTLVLSASGALAAAILAQKFGRDAETDGLLAAYGVYVVLTLAAQALRLTAVPELTRTGGAAAGAYAGAILAVGVPATVAAWALAAPIGDALTGSLPESSADLAASALPWFVAAAFGQLLAALAAAVLAVHDRFGAAALGFAAGGIAGLLLFVVLADEHGVVALAWGVALSAAVAVGVPLTALAAGGLRGSEPRSPGGELRGLRPRGVAGALGRMAEAAAVPVALQGLYLIALRLAAELGVGSVTSLSYAYFFAAVMVAATATSIAAISAAPLTRRGLESDEAVAHVVHGAWLSLPVVAAAAGVFALAGDQIAGSVLGDEFSGEVGVELSRLVVVLAPWMVAAVGFSLSFPLLYVVERSRVLVPVAIGAVAVHIPLALALRRLWGLEGLALALGLSTLGVLAVLLLALSPQALERASAALARIALAVAALVAASFGVAALVLSDAAAAAAGLGGYALLLAVVRPRGLREAWAYVHGLHDSRTTRRET